MDQLPEDKATSKEVSAVLLKLSENRHFDQLHTVLRAIYHAESAASAEAGQRMKDSFKLILLSLGED